MTLSSEQPAKLISSYNYLHVIRVACEVSQATDTNHLLAQKSKPKVKLDFSISQVGYKNRSEHTLANAKFWHFPDCLWQTAFTSHTYATSTHTITVSVYSTKRCRNICVCGYYTSYTFEVIVPFVHSDQGDDAGVLLNSLIYTVSVPEFANKNPQKAQWLQMCTTYNNHKHKISKPDKLNCSQPSTADNHNNWRAWIVAVILHCSPPMWNQRLKVRCRRMCHVITNGKVLFWLKYTQTQTRNFLQWKDHK